MFTISYTSGSTGRPKGVVHSNFGYYADLIKGVPEVNFVYCPLAHSDRSALHGLFINGGRAAIFEGDMGTLFAHAKEIQPSAFSGPPRVWNKIFNDFNASLSSSGANEENYTEIEAKLIEEFSHIFGDRVHTVSTGSAPTSDAVVDFMRKCFKRVIDGYGTKECGGVAANNVISSVANVKLVDYEEFKISDKPYPRGEICARTPGMASGYYNNPEATAEHFKDGWFHTGDIGQMMGNGYLVVIGRKKQIFKLSQGEFVSPERLENFFQKSTFVAQIYLYGESLDSFLVGIIVPDKFQVYEWAKKEGLEKESFESLCEDQKLIDAILLDLRSIASNIGLRSFEVPKGMHLTPLPFTEENNQLTYSQKINRSGIKSHYDVIITTLLEKTRRVVAEEDIGMREERKEGERGKEKGMAVVSQTHAKLSALLKKTLGVENDDIKEILINGCDSLAATQFVCQIKDHFKVDLPLNALYTSKHILDIVQIIDRSRGSSSPLASATKDDYASDSMLPSNISLDNFANKMTHFESAALPKSGVVLLTGVTGFLGSHLLHELLFQTKSEVMCMVRKKENEEIVMQSIIDAMQYYELWDPSFLPRIIPVKGDLSLAHFGWNDEEYEKRGKEIDVVYHNGATVNAMLPYSLLRSQNVTSAIELLSFATTFKLKPVHYISSVSVFAGMKGKNDTIFSENDIPTRSPPDGYSMSKYYAESLFRQASLRGVPVIIYRPGSISGSTKTGASNSPAFVNRLISGISLMGCYPVHDSNNQINIELVPVDYVSKAIIYISMQPEGFEKLTFNLINPVHIPLAKIADYISSFYKTKLKAIPFDAWKNKIHQQTKQSSSSPSSSSPSSSSSSPSSSSSSPSFPNPLVPVLATHFPGNSFVAMQKFLCENTYAVLRGSPDSEGLICPEVSEMTIHSYLQFYIKRGIIPPVNV